REGLFQEDRPVPDHAPGGHPQVAGAAISVAAGQRLQGVLRGQGARHGRPHRRQRLDGDVAVAGGRDQGDHGGHGDRLLALRRAREPARDRGARPIRARAGPHRPQGRGRGDVRPLDFRHLEDLTIRWPESYEISGRDDPMPGPAAACREHLFEASNRGISNDGAGAMKKLVLETTAPFQGLPELVAYDEGLFEKEGLLVEWADREHGAEKTVELYVT